MSCTTKQLITIKPDGSLVGLQVKKGKGLDLREFGRAKIVRSTLIEWDEDYQGWYVRFLNGAMKDQILNRAMFWGYRIHPLHKTVRRSDAAMIYADYEDAVIAEVAAVQGMRKAWGSGIC